jgi:tetratricopeptide (TPR) repeat protein
VDVADAHHDLGLALAETGQPGDARHCYERALALRPEFPEALNNLGILLEDQGAHDQAEARYRAALQLQPNSADTFNNLGVTLAAQRRHEEAVESYRQALRIKPQAPLPWNNLGNALRTLGEVDEAIDCLRKAIALRSDYAEAHNNLGIGLVQLGLHQQAQESYEQALHLRPQYPEAHLNRSLAWLGESDFVRGWTEYEWRWNVPGTKKRACRQPLWSGALSPLQTLLLYFEQGLGDTLHFIRYAEMARRRVGRVIAEVQAPLVPLLSRCRGIDELIAAGAAVPAFDVRLPLLSLPGALGTQLDTIPADAPYIFAEPQRVEAWRRRLAEVGGLRVGIGWQGNPQYRGDRQRSIPLHHFARLAEIADVQMISLQKGEGTAQIAKLEKPFLLVEFTDLDAAGGAFMDTAAVIENLDLVITSDTALPHLAGALGVETWIALPFAADWRWLRDRDDSPWYPTVRLFRQERPGDWQGVFDRIAAELTARAASRRKSVMKSDRPASARVESVRVESARAEFKRGTELAKSGKLLEAEESLRTAVAIDAEFAEANHNLGVVLARSGRHGDAITAFLRTLEIDAGYGEAAANLGLAYLQSGQAAAAIAALRQAMRRGVNTPDVYNHLGVALSRCGKTAEAVTAYRTAMRLAPDFAAAHINVARAYLALGLHDEAWIEQEWRWSTQTSKNRRFRQPRWTGEPLNGRTILVYADETSEDALPCLPHLVTLRERGGRVVVASSKELLPVFSETRDVYTAVPLADELPEHDIYVPLLSLPWLLGRSRASI